MPDLSKLNPQEQTELLKLLEHDEVIEPPTIVFTVTHISSNEPSRALPPIYPIWWKGREWWNALPRAKRRELVATGTSGIGEKVTTMPRSDTDGLTEKEQSELLRLLEEEQENTLSLIHSVPRPHRPGQALPMMTADGKVTRTVTTPAAAKRKRKELLHLPVRTKTSNSMQADATKAAASKPIHTSAPNRLWSVDVGMPEYPATPKNVKNASR